MQRFMPDLKACTAPLTSPFVLCNTDSFCETPKWVSGRPHFFLVAAKNCLGYRGISRYYNRI